MTSSDKPVFPPWLEWELLEEECKISNPTIGKPLPGVPREIKIWRNEDYKMKAEISGTATICLFDFKPEPRTAGKIFQTFEISGKTEYEVVYDLSGCILGDISIQYEPTELESSSGTFHTQLNLERLRMEYQKDKPAAWLTEWFINGIERGSVLIRPTSRRIGEIYYRGRTEIEVEPKKFETGWNEEHSVDFSFIRCDDFGFIIHGVPKSFGPEWSDNIGIEYREDCGGIPDKEKRAVIAEIVSFVLGKHLLLVGHTSFDASGFLIEGAAVNPWGDNVRHLSQSANIPPIRIYQEEERGNIEAILPPLIRKYLELRDKLKLNEVLWRYWIGSELPLGSNIPIMANGIEILTKYWFKSQKSRSKGIYLPKDEFDSITGEEFERIGTKLEENPSKEKILNKLKGGYSMTLTDRLKFFFSEIELIIGDREQEAINCRHKMIHSNVLTRDAEIEKVIRLSYAYRCLFHRTLLKILGYTGKYIDYSMSGLPEKSIDAAVGIDEPQ